MKPREDGNYTIDEQHPPTPAARIYEGLIERLEKGEGSDCVLDGEIEWALGDWTNLGGGYRRHKTTGEAERFNYTLPSPQLTASLDAALSLVERMLPGHGWDVANMRPDIEQFYAAMWAGGWLWNGKHPKSAPRALLIALLKTLQENPHGK